MRLRIRRNDYKGDGTVLRYEDGFHIVRPDQPITLEDFLRKWSGPEGVSPRLVETANQAFSHFGCLGPGGEVTCLPIRDPATAEILDPTAGMKVAWAEKGPEHFGVWMGRIASVDRGILRLRPEKPLEALEGLDLPESTVLDALTPEDLHDEVTEISQDMHRRWTMGGFAPIPGRWLRARTSHREKNKGGAPAGPLETKAWVLDRPMPISMLLGACEASGLPVQECVLHGGKLLTIPLALAPKSGVKARLHPFVPDLGPRYIIHQGPGLE